MRRATLCGMLWLLATLSTTVRMAAQDAAPSPSPYNLGGANPALSPQETAGVQITQAWIDKSLQAMTTGPDGAVQFSFGDAMPSIVCAPFQVTDLELQPGEEGHEVEIGDDQRWVKKVAASGEDPKTLHVLLRPKQIGIETTLVITTDLRTYRIRLVSDEKKFMAHVTFAYHDGLVPKKPVAEEAPAESTPAPSPVTEVPKAHVAMIESGTRRPAVKTSQAASRASGGKAAVFLGKAEAKDRDFRIQGSAPFRPTQVYTDGKKTYIELPENVQETPVLFRVKKGGFLGLGHQLSDVNGRVHGNWYVADTVLDRAVLVSGVGSAQQKVTITREAR
jgi:type IV secretion system protein TrbG